MRAKYIEKEHSEYPVWSSIDCINAYEYESGEWLPCPRCGLKPKVWEFDNGRSTACGCRNSMYDHFSIHAESICSVMKRTGGSVVDFDDDELRTNWNHYCKTGEIL